MNAPFRNGPEVFPYLSGAPRDREQCRRLPEAPHPQPQCPIPSSDQSRIDVGQPFRDYAELQGRAFTLPFGDRQTSEKGFGLGIAVGARRQHDHFIRRSAYADRPPCARTGQAVANGCIAHERAFSSEPYPSEGRGVNGARDRYALVYERDIDREFAVVSDKLLGSIEWINQQESIGYGYLLAQRRRIPQRQWG